MSFERPWMLWGLLAAFLPVLIHLINRHRARLRRFAALEYLLLSNKRVARRLRLRQLLVMALRVLLVVIIALALAKPFWEPEPGEVVAAGVPGAVVLVIDDSMSMQTMDDAGQTRLERALERARDVVRSGGRLTRYAVVTAGKPSRQLTRGLSYDQDTVLRALDRITSGAKGPDMPNALAQAERILEASGEARRHVVVIGDQAVHAWSGVVQPWALSEIPSVELLDVSGAEPVANLAVASVEISPAGEVGPNHVRFDVTVVNHGPEAMDARVTLRLGDQTLVGVQSVAAGARGAVSFTESVDTSGAVVMASARVESDRLAVDDVYYFTVDFGARIHVGMVNGAPRSIAHRDELFYLRSALQPSHEGGARLTAWELEPSDINSERLAHMDVVILANVGEITPLQKAAIVDFVQRGGGLLVTGGDQMTTASSETYGELLPYGIRDVKKVANEGEASASLHALNLAQVDLSHEVMRIFDGLRDASLFKARTFSYLLLESTHRPGASVLANFNGGQPALVEAPMGQGRLMMWVTTIDRDWSDLVVRTCFVPLVQQVVRYLAGALDQSQPNHWRVSEPVVVAAPSGQGPLSVVRPDGVEVPVDVQKAASPMEADRVELPETVLPGHYVLHRTTDRARSVVVAVNADRAESDLSRVDTKTLRATLSRPGEGLGMRRADVAEVSSEQDVNPRTRLWPYALLALFGLLISEAWLAIRG